MRSFEFVHVPVVQSSLALCILLLTASSSLCAIVVDPPLCPKLADQNDASCTLCGADDDELRRRLEEEATVNNNRTLSILNGADSFEACSPPCARQIEFCGSDASCHANTCDNFYQYGNRLYTGVESENPPPLTCETLDQPESTVPIAVSYWCPTGSILNQAPSCLEDSEDAMNSLLFHRVCSANPTESLVFVCYDMVGIDDATLEAYDQQTQDNPGIDCTSSSTSSPRYSYELAIGRSIVNATSSSSSNLRTPPSSESLNGTLAVSSLRSVIRSVPTEDPSTTPSPDPAASIAISSPQKVMQTALWSALFALPVMWLSSL